MLFTPRKRKKEDSIQKHIFVIGAPAIGKTYFIKQNYNNKEVDILNIYDYQQRACEES